MGGMYSLIRTSLQIVCVQTLSHTLSNGNSVGNSGRSPAREDDYLWSAFRLCRQVSVTALDPRCEVLAGLLALGEVARPTAGHDIAYLIAPLRVESIESAV